MSFREHPVGSLFKDGPRQRDKAHLAFIAGLPCLVCGTTPVHVAHVRYAEPGSGKRYVGKGEKPDDRWTVPLCPRCHLNGPEAQHRIGEREFWRRADIDPIAVAAKLYAATGDRAAAHDIIRRRGR